VARELFKRMQLNSRFVSLDALHQWPLNRKIAGHIHYNYIGASPSLLREPTERPSDQSASRSSYHGTRIETTLAALLLRKQSQRRL
jgi:hypothetical protein